MQNAHLPEGERGRFACALVVLTEGFLKAELQLLGAFPAQRERTALLLLMQMQPDVGPRHRTLRPTDLTGYGLGLRFDEDLLRVPLMPNPDGQLDPSRSLYAGLIMLIFAGGNGQSFV